MATVRRRRAQRPGLLCGICEETAQVDAVLASAANGAGSPPIRWGRQRQCDAGAQMRQAGGAQTNNYWLFGDIRGIQLVPRGRHQNRIEIVSPVIAEDLSEHLIGKLGVDDVR